MTETAHSDGEGSGTASAPKADACPSPSAITKTCRLCKIEKPADAKHFTRNYRTTDRLTVACRTCRGAPQRPAWVPASRRKEQPIIATYAQPHWGRHFVLPRRGRDGGG